MSHYRLAKRLGAGGMGVVYRARDERLGRDVALKLLPPALHADPDARRRLTQEARAAAALDHPNVASVYDVGEADDGRVFLVMGFYDGDTLADEIARGPLDADRAQALGRQIADGLAAIHRAGIVHRDIKPANVIVLPGAAPGGGPCAKILDFGIAKTDGAQLTREGQSVGTELYMSPEQILGDPVDARADVWGLGAVLYEMLAGRSPFGGLYAAAVSFNVLHRDPRPIERDDVSDALEAVVTRCLEKAPEGRYASMDELAAALDAPETAEPLVASPTASTEATPAPGPPPSPVARSQDAGSPSSWRRWALAAAALVLVALGLAAALRASSGEAETARLAVLPFRAVGAETEQLSVGLVETLTSKLSQLESLRGRVRIVPASEVTGETTSSEARSRLRATHVVEGVVQVENGRIRVSLNLIDVRSDPSEQLDAGQVDGASGGGFAIQDEAVVHVADMLRSLGLLRVEVSIGELAAGGTDDPEANALFLRGRGALKNQQSLDDLARARALFEAALALDSDFALAHAALADARWETYRATQDLSWTDRAIASAERARQLDDGIAEVHTVLGTIHDGRSDYDRAVVAFDRALELDPDNAEAVRRLGRVYARQGRTADAERTLLRAVELAPDVWRTRNSLGSFYLQEGRAVEAEAEFQTALERDPVNLSLLFNLALAAERNGDFETAERAHDQILQLDPEHAQAAAGLLRVRFYLRDYTRAAEAGALATTLRPDDYALKAGLAEARWWAPGQREQARSDYQAAIELTRGHLDFDRSTDVLASLASSFAAIGARDSALVYLREIEQRTLPAEARVSIAYTVGVAYETIGERARSLAWLQSALTGGFGQTQATRSPRLAGLRASPAFRSLLTRSPTP